MHAAEGTLADGEGLGMVESTKLGSQSGVTAGSNQAPALQLQPPLLGYAQLCLLLLRVCASGRQWMATSPPAALQQPPPTQAAMLAAAHAQRRQLWAEQEQGLRPLRQT
jgi:hypothetical protein